jgi:hypothetical protein
MRPRKPQLPSLLLIAALGLGLPAPRPARAAEDLQAFVATMPLTGSTIDLTAVGSLDWAHWGYGMTGGPFGQTTTPTTNRKIMSGPALISALQVLPPPSGGATYWSPARSMTVAFRWSDGTPVRNPGTGVSVTEGIGSTAESSFILRAQSGPDLRQLSIYVAFDCTGLGQVDVTLGKKMVSLTSNLVCVGSAPDENHQITIRYSSDSRVDVVATIKGGLFGGVGPTVYASTLAPVTSSGEPGSIDAGTDPDAGASADAGAGGSGAAGGASTGAAGANGGSAAGGGGGRAAGAGGASGGGAAGEGSGGNVTGGASGSRGGASGQAGIGRPSGRVLACSLPADAQGSPTGVAISVAWLWFTARRRRRAPEGDTA